MVGRSGRLPVRPLFGHPPAHGRNAPKTQVTPVDKQETKPPKDVPEGSPTYYTYYSLSFYKVTRSDPSTRRFRSWPHPILSASRLLMNPQGEGPG